MGRFYRTITERDFGVVDPLDPEQLEPPDRADDVENCVDCSHFMEMQVVRCHSVDCSFDCGDRLESGVRRARHLFRNFYGIYQSMDLGDRPAVWLFRNVEVDFDAAHSGALHVGDADSDTFQTECSRQSFEPRFVESVVDERADEHVAGDTAGGIEDRDLHDLEFIEWNPSNGSSSTHYIK